MPNSYVLDAHALIWYFEGNPRLGNQAKECLNNKSSNLILPIIALAEASWSVEHHKTTVPSIDVLLAALNLDPRFLIEPLDMEILILSQSLHTISEMHDRLIAASALHRLHAGEDVKLLTKDANIIQSGLIPILW